MSDHLPRVSIAFPLYRSAPFVENVAANIDRLGDLDAEILLSDRHSLDDALEQLEARYRSDPRVRVLRKHDGADWVTHYNDLLCDARGTYFCWMPHDDHYDAGYVQGLASALDAHPEAILAFGVMHAEAAPGVTVPVGPFVPPPIDAARAWSTRSALRLLLFWDLFRTVRGLMRREAVIGRRLLVPRTYQTVQADVCWAFAVATAGPMCFVPAVSCTKRYHPSSASAGWRYGVREAASEWRVMSQSAWRHSATRKDAVLAVGLLGGVATMRIVWRVMRPIVGRSGARAPTPVRQRVFHALGRVLAGRR